MFVKYVYRKSYIAQLVPELFCNDECKIFMMLSILLLHYLIIKEHIFLYHSFALKEIHCKSCRNNSQGNIYFRMVEGCHKHANFILHYYSI